MSTTWLETIDDMEWLRAVHGAPTDLACAILTGNEDCPERIEGWRAFNPPHDTAPDWTKPAVRRAVFNVTYDIVTDESAEGGDTAERGHIAKGATLRDAIDYRTSTRTSAVGGVECVACDEWPVSSPRWITVTNGREYETGAVESRSLHMPEHLTASTRRRIARLCGVRV